MKIAFLSWNQFREFKGCLVIRASLMFALLPLFLFSYAHAEMDLSIYVLDNEKIVSEGSSILIATHLSAQYDKTQSSRQGASKAIEKAFKSGVESYFLLGWPAEGLSEHERKRLARIGKRSRSDLIDGLRPHILRDSSQYFMPTMVRPALYVGSSSGVLSGLELPKVREATVVGGFLEMCLGFSIESLLQAFAKNSQPKLIIRMVSDGIYLRTCGELEYVNLKQCRGHSLTEFDKVIAQTIRFPAIQEHGLQVEVVHSIGDTSYDDPTPMGKKVIFIIEDSNQLRFVTPIP